MDPEHMTMKAGDFDGEEDRVMSGGDGWASMPVVFLRR
jgi:hypothetical protein